MPSQDQTVKFQELGDHANARLSASKEVVTALLVIGGKILSGRTKDQNIGYIAEYLTALGIDLKEVRVVGDEETAIVNALSMRSGPSRSTARTVGPPPAGV
jgi:hypothetical protein